MNILKAFYLATLFSCSLLSACNVNYTPRSQSYKSNNGPPMEAGKCYAKSKILSTTLADVVTLPMYIGSDSSSVEFDKYIVQEGEKRTKWVKKKADKNCLSKNPDECLVWCLVESNYDEI